MTDFIELNSGDGQPLRVLASEIAVVDPRYLGWLQPYLAGSIIHMKNREKLDVVESPELVMRKIEEATK